MQEWQSTIAAVKFLLRAQAHASATLEQKTCEEGYVLLREGELKNTIAHIHPKPAPSGLGHTLLFFLGFVLTPAFML